MRLVCLSDTHNAHRELDVPDGDVLLHAGDFTRAGTPAEVEAFGAFLGELPHPEKIVVAGNHDFLFEREPERARSLLGDVTYLEDSGTQIGDLCVWGSPWQPWFHDWAFNLPRGEAIAEKWERIPDDTDVLVTHGPPMAVLDRCADGRLVGCEELGKALARVQPRLHVFGHIHESYGTKLIGSLLHVNACSCDLRYRAANPPIVVEWDGEEMRLVGV